MEPAEILDSLIKKLNKYYDSSIHTEVDLRMREEISDKGGLCGMAAMYQAGLQTLFTISQIKQMGFEDLKIQLGAKLKMDESDSKKAKDKELLENFYAGKMLLIYLSKNNNMYLEMCENAMATTSTSTTTASTTETTTTLAAQSGANPSPSSSSGLTPSPHVYTEIVGDGTDKRYNMATRMSGSYSTGQECCDLCAASNQNFRWISWDQSGASDECWCKTTPASSEPSRKSGTSNFKRGSCLLPVEYAYTETGTGKRYMGGSSVSGSYSDGQGCCDLCYNNNDNVKWIAWVKPETSSPAECRCHSLSGEPSVT